MDIETGSFVSSCHWRGPQATAIVFPNNATFALARDVHLLKEEWRQINGRIRGLELIGFAVVEHNTDIGRIEVFVRVHFGFWILISLFFVFGWLVDRNVILFIILQKISK